MFRKKSTSDPNEAVGSNDIPLTVGPATIDHGIADRVIQDSPVAQNAIDVFAGEWISSFPPVFGLHAGDVPLFDDGRIKRLLGRMDSIKNSKILELAPLEGGHTYMLHEAGAKVIAIESRTHAFLRCLVVKELLNLNRAHFFLGDFVAYLESTHDRFDMVLASGVLYNQTDPIGLLESIAKVTDRVAIWTHYWDDAAIAAHPSLSTTLAEPAADSPWHGRSVTTHALRCEGASPDDDTVFARWMERDGLLTVLAELGFSNVEVLDDQPGHEGGPAILLLAER